MMHASGKLNDIKAGRILELKEISASEGVKARKATAFLITGVAKYRSSVEVTGVKLNRAGNAHPSGKQHTVDAVVGQFRVLWENDGVAAAEPDNVQHADGTEGTGV